MTTAAETGVGSVRVTPVGGRWSEWERFVRALPQSTFAHQGAWATLVHELFGHETSYLVAEGATGEWRGVLPLVHLRGVLGHHLLSMPFLNDGGPLGDEVARVALADAALTLARDSRAKALELRTRTPLPGSDSGGRKVAVHLQLPASVDELWSATFKAKLRSQIRRPGKEGMTARVGPDELDAFYDVFRRNMRDLGTPVLPRGFFAALRETFGEQVMFVSVRARTGAPAAAACCLTWREEMEVTWASSVREFNPLSPNMLLYATLMEQAIQRGVRLFNFGRSTPGAPTHRFKQQWGGVDVPLPWVTWPPAISGDPGHSALLRAAVALWQRLPLPVANRLGPLIAGHLPW